MVKLSMLQKSLWIKIVNFNKNMYMMMKFNKYNQAYSNGL